MERGARVLPGTTFGSSTPYTGFIAFVLGTCFSLIGTPSLSLLVVVPGPLTAGLTLSEQYVIHGSRTDRAVFWIRSTGYRPLHALSQAPRRPRRVD